MDEFCSNLRTYVSKMGKVRYLRVDGHDYDAYLKSIYFHRQGKGWFQNQKSTYNSGGGPRGKDSLGFPSTRVKGGMESDKRPLGKERKGLFDRTLFERGRLGPPRRSCIFIG